MSLCSVSRKIIVYNFKIVSGYEEYNIGYPPYVSALLYRIEYNNVRISQLPLVYNTRLTITANNIFGRWGQNRVLYIFRYYHTKTVHKAVLL